MKSVKEVLVTGGAGYVGAVLVPKLLQAGYRVRVLDLFLFGEEPLASVSGQAALECIKGDIRDRDLVRRAVTGCDAVIHLACISNDPSFELNPDLGRSINYDAFEPLVEECARADAPRFIYASSSSVYGVSDADNVTEEHPLNPIADYSRYKSLCEPILLGFQSRQFTTTIVRPATVCGYSPRQRLDLTVNILTNHAVNRGTITVFGGSQLRPNIHIDDLVELYLLLLKLPPERIAGRIYNAGYQNRSVRDLATTVRDLVQRNVPGREKVEIVTTPTDDERSYRISSEKIQRDLGFVPRRTIEQAVLELVEAFRLAKIPDPLNGIQYYNLKTLQRALAGDLLSVQPALATA